MNELYRRSEKWDSVDHGGIEHWYVKEHNPKRFRLEHTLKKLFPYGQTRTGWLQDMVQRRN